MPGFSIRGAWPHGTIRANGSSLSLVLIERIAHVRGGGCWKSPLRHAFGMTPPPKGEARLGSPFGGAGTAAAVTERAATNSQPSPGEAAFSLPHRPGKALRCFPSFFSCAARPVRARSWGAAPHPAAFEKAGKTFTLASLGTYSSHNTFNVSTSSCFSIPHSCAAFTASCRCSSTRRSCSSFKNSVFFPATKLPFPGTE